jgi:hypothetical protein
MQIPTIRLIFNARLLTGLIAVFFSITSHAQITLSENQVLFDKNSGNYSLNSNQGEFFRFTPSMADVSKADSLTEDYLLKESPSEAGIGKYYRQYIGVIRGGLEVVIVYLYCRKPEGFLEQVYLVRGGGRCYSTAIVNPKGDKVISLLFNAPK